MELTATPPVDRTGFRGNKFSQQWKQKQMLLLLTEKSMPVPSCPGKQRGRRRKKSLDGSLELEILRAVLPVILALFIIG